MRIREKAVGASFLRRDPEVALERPAELTVSRTGPPDTEARVPLRGNSGGTTEKVRPEPFAQGVFLFLHGIRSESYGKRVAEGL